MKYIILVFGLIFVTCCKSNNDIESNDSFFETYSFKLNKDILPDSISFEEDYLDYHFPELGTIKKTKTSWNVKYDTVSHYVVILKGCLNFKENKYKYETEDIKSISLTHLSIWKLSNQRKKWECTKDSDIILGRLPIPKNYLDMMKRDFLFVNRNTIINVNKNDRTSNSFPLTRVYKLY